MYEFAGFRLDLRARRLLHGSQVIPITVKAFDIRAGHSPYATAGAAASATGQPLCLTLSLPGTAPLTLGASSPFALSPDGKTLAYAGRAQDGSCLYVRRLDRLEASRAARTN